MAASASQPTASAPALASDPAVSGSASGPASAPKSAPASAPTPLAPAPTQKTTPATPATEEFLRATFGDSDDEDDIPNNLSQIENNDKGDDNDDDNDDDDDDDDDNDNINGNIKEEDDNDKKLFFQKYQVSYLFGTTSSV